MKKVKSILSLATLLCVVSSSAIFASEKIPSQMNPGTVIQYDSNKNMNVLREGNANINKKSTKNYKASSDFLEIKSGMTVVYDALWGPIVVGSYDSDTDENSENDQDNNGIETYSSNPEQGYVSDNIILDMAKKFFAKLAGVGEGTFYGEI